MVDVKRNLSTDLRPQRLSEIIGYEDVVSEIRNSFASGRVPSTMLFSGEFGSGKTTMARIVAVSLQCTHTPVFGEPCDACLAATWDIQEINASELNGVNEMKTLVDRVGYMPQSGRFKVVLLDEAQRITEAAQNLLLKYTEEPHDALVWIICTTEPNKLLKPLRSRCTTFTVNGLFGLNIYKLVERGLKEINSTLDAKSLGDALVRMQIFSPRLILMAVEKYAAGATAEVAANIAEPTQADTLGICRASVKGDWAEVSKLLQAAAPSDGREIRRSVAGYFRVIMVKSTGDRARMCADAIQELLKVNVFEDGLQLSNTAAALFNVCQMISERRKP